MKRPFMLMILDGFGLKNDAYGNAIKAANTPNLDRIFDTYPNVSLAASGLAVGLPEGQMGNSEVGHLNIGAGRVVYQELTRITKAIEDGVFAGNAAILGAIDHAKKTGGALHVMPYYLIKPTLGPHSPCGSQHVRHMTIRRRKRLSPSSPSLKATGAHTQTHTHTQLPCSLEA